MEKSRMQESRGKTIKHSAAGPSQKSPRTKKRIAVSIMLLLDATGSMGECIAGVVKALLEFVGILRKSEVEPSLGLVVFRDELCGERPQVLPLGTAPETICDLLRHTEAIGGGDDPESSLPAIARAIEQFKRGDAQAKRVILLVTDERPHDPEAGHTARTILTALKENKVILFACTRPFIQAYRDFSNVTGGTLFPLRDDMDSEAFKDVILDVGHETVKTVRHDGPLMSDEAREILRGIPPRG